MTTLKGVGPSLSTTLQKLGIFRLIDLLLHLPIRYQDRTHLVPLRQLQAGQECLVQGQVVDSQVVYGRRRSWVVTLEDGTGYLSLRFFHFSKPQQAGLKTGHYVRCFGEVRFGPKGLEMAHPEYRAFAVPPEEPEGRLTPVYPTTKGLGQGRLRNLTSQLADLSWPDGQSTPFQTLLYLHRPPADASQADIEQAQERVARDELTAYYLIMRHRQSQRAHQRALALPRSQQLGRELLKNLGFELTGAQRRVATEVLLDLEQAMPMLRLLQGDVGSGKTVIAAFAAIRAAEHGAQTALMAPTEILAEQHYFNFSTWLAPLGISVVLLTGAQTLKQRRPKLAALADGEALVAIGTHALFQHDVEFANLALTIVDEQHRFGVHQRMALRAKGRTPHQLVMTATPIPRTLTMALYADMDVSTIDELPAGRQPISTRAVPESRRGEVLERIRGALEGQQQAYWVCTLIEDSEQLNAQSAEATWQTLKVQLPGINIGLLHGRMKSEEKAKVMAAFNNNECQLLVATTVIEVGVDVPNATLMVIENPERLGLAQLHQLRGRIGRGAKASHCLLLYKEGLSEVAKARLKIIRESQDGFYIAEQDLKLRGPGELLGTRQTGETQFRVANLRAHAHLIPDVVRTGDRLLKEAPGQAQALLAAWAPPDTGSIAV
ncbi:MAG: ATP-dependent DNA helicase RecG [Gammaproteobacteria bacterium]|nr:ATP-dependent DNA helicase RecG [Gammaproteobacteria bacterium]